MQTQHPPAMSLRKDIDMAMHHDKQLIKCYIRSIGAVGNWTVTALSAAGGESTYPIPSGDLAEPCHCNTVFYSLVMACATCQGFGIVSWDAWISNCKGSDVSKSFPDNLPPGTIVPSWADIDPTISGSWNITQAQQYAGPSFPIYRVLKLTSLFL